MRGGLLALVLVLGMGACGGADGGDSDTTDPGNGSLVGQKLPDLTFRDPVTGQDVSTLAFQGSADVKALLVNAAAGWCTVCKAEAPELAAWHEAYATRGLTILYTLFEDAEGTAPPADTFAKGWCNALDLPFTCLIDQGFATGGGLAPYFDPSLAPLNLLVRTADMTVIYAGTGFNADTQAVLESKIEHLLGP